MLIVRCFTVLFVASGFALGPLLAALASIGPCLLATPFALDSGFAFSLLLETVVVVVYVPSGGRFASTGILIWLLRTLVFAVALSSFRFFGSWLFPCRVSYALASGPCWLCTVAFWCRRPSLPGCAFPITFAFSPAFAWGFLWFIMPMLWFARLVVLGCTPSLATPPFVRFVCCVGFVIPQGFLVALACATACTSRFIVRLIPAFAVVTVALVRVMFLMATVPRVLFVRGCVKRSFATLVPFARSFLPCDPFRCSFVCSVINLREPAAVFHLN